MYSKFLIVFTLFSFLAVAQEEFPLLELERIVLSEHPGEVTHRGLEQKNGRTFISFKILRFDDSIHEFWVDPRNKQIVLQKILIKDSLDIPEIKAWRAN